jgi:DNA-binding CsgD family transcriptional regulator
MDEFVRDPRVGRTKELTPRQWDVLHLLAEDRTMQETADLLHLTPRTVAFHKYRIIEEFGLKTNSNLVRFVLRQRIVSLPTVNV